MAFLPIEDIRFFRYRVHSPWEEMEAAFIFARLSSLQCLAHLLAATESVIRWRFLFIHHAERIHTHSHVHILFHLYAHQKSRDWKEFTDMVEILSYHDANDSIYDSHEQRGLCIS